MASTATHKSDTAAFNAITATDGSGIQLLNMANAFSGTLAVARGGTGVGTIGGTNAILYTTSADVLSSIASVNSAVMITSAGGVPSFSTTLPAVSGANLTSLNAGNISSGTLVVGRGGTGVTTFGGTNTLLYTTAANTLSSITTANSAVLITNGSGVPSWGTTLPAVSGANLTSLNAGNISTGTLAVARGGTGVTTFGGVNQLLYTSDVDLLSAVVKANNSILVSNGTGVPGWSTTLPAANGSALTTLNASNVSSGTLADARLSGNVPLINASNSWTGNVNTFTSAGGSGTGINVVATGASNYAAINMTNDTGVVLQTGCYGHSVSGFASDGFFYLFNGGHLGFYVGSNGTPSVDQRMKLRSDGYMIVKAPASAPADASLDQNGCISFWLDEAGNNLKFKCKKSDGTVKTGTLAIV